MKNCVYAAGILISGLCFSQETGSKVKASFFDGVVVAGYVDHGAFINFTGPNISFTHKGLKLIAGMLPSLRIKEDHSPGTKNSPITPKPGRRSYRSVQKDRSSDTGLLQYKNICRKRSLESRARAGIFFQIDFYYIF